MKPLRRASGKWDQSVSRSVLTDRTQRLLNTLAPAELFAQADEACGSWGFYLAMLNTIPISQRKSALVHRDTRDIGTQDTQETEILRDRELKETQDTHDSARKCRVATISDAVEISLSAGINETCLFVFARALKAFEVESGVRLDRPSLESSFSQWWATAKLLLPDGEAWDIWQAEFLMAFEKVRTPLGASTLERALQAVESEPWPVACSKFSPAIGRVLAACHHLQRLCGEASFFLSVRDAQRIGGFRTTHTAQAVLMLLVRDGFLKLVETGTIKGRKATRFTLGKT